MTAEDPQLAPESAATDVTDQAARADLRRYRMVATGLLGVMGGLAVAALALPHGFWIDLLGASARAGLVGGIADWFAITALFRHPLGLPIPHTAIIPRQKARLGAALGRFVAEHVFTAADVTAMLERFDVGGLLRDVLADPRTAGPAGRVLASWLPRLLATVDDGRARRLTARLVPRMLGSAAAGAVVARALRSLVAGGKHQEVFGFVLEQLRDGLAAQEGVLRQTIEERVREQGGRLVGWAIGGSVARRVLHAINAEFDKMSPDQSALRVAFDSWARHEIDAMEEDPARAAELGAAIRRVVGHDSVQQWLWDIWGRLRATIERDAAQPDGRTQMLLAGALADLGRTLGEDPAMRARLQAAAAGLVEQALPGLRLQLAGFIGRVVAGWDTATIVERLELRIGRDLQFVRINGTVVGFLVGGVLQVSLWLLGRH